MFFVSTIRKLSSVWEVNEPDNFILWKQNCKINDENIFLNIIIKIFLIKLDNFIKFHFTIKEPIEIETINEWYNFW